MVLLVDLLTLILFSESVHLTQLTDKSLYKQFRVCNVFTEIYINNDWRKSGVVSSCSLCDSENGVYYIISPPTGSIICGHVSEVMLKADS